MCRPRRKNTTIAPLRALVATAMNAMLGADTRARRYHPVDLEPMCYDEHENPDWLVGAN